MADLKKLLISGDLTILDAMKQLDEAAKQILFVADDNKLLGTLTDGDVRRYLLKGGNLSGKVHEACNKHPKYIFEDDVNNAQSFLKLNRIVSVPIVKKDMTILSIVFATGEELTKSEKINLPVVIMAGGKGTRLYPYTKILPKPLIPIGELPICEHIMNYFQKAGCEKYIFVVNHKKQMIKAYFSDNEKSEQVSFIDEDIPLGTGGGLSLLKGKISEPFFLTNCDVIIRTDYSEIYKFHKDNGNAITMVCAYKHFKIPYGVIDMGVNGAIEKMVEKPEYSFLTNTGMYIVEPYVLDDIQDNFSQGFTDIIESQISKGRKVAVYPVSEKSWLDMGEMDSFENMRKELGV